MDKTLCVVGGILPMILGVIAICIGLVAFSISAATWILSGPLSGFFAIILGMRNFVEGR